MKLSQNINLYHLLIIENTKGKPHLKKSLSNFTRTGQCNIELKFVGNWSSAGDYSEILQHGTECKTFENTVINFKVT